MYGAVLRLRYTECHSARTPPTPPPLPLATKSGMPSHGSPRFVKTESLLEKGGQVWIKENGSL
jgi:hypothetical protein